MEEDFIVDINSYLPKPKFVLLKNMVPKRVNKMKKHFKEEEKEKKNKLLEDSEEEVITK